MSTTTGKAYQPHQSFEFTGQRLEQQAADRAADGIVESMASFSELALERELESVMSQLRADPPLLYSLSSYLRDGTLKKLMNGEFEPAAPAAAKLKDALKPRQKKVEAHFRTTNETHLLAPYA